MQPFSLSRSLFFSSLCCSILLSEGLVARANPLDLDSFQAVEESSDTTLHLVEVGAIATEELDEETEPAKAAHPPDEDASPAAIAIPLPKVASDQRAEVATDGPSESSSPEVTAKTGTAFSPSNEADPSLKQAAIAPTSTPVLPTDSANWPENFLLASELFQPVIDRLRQQLQSGQMMRLPEKIWLTEPQNTYKVRIVEDTDTQGWTVQLLRCEADFDDCFIGSFSTSAPQAAPTKAAFRAHQAASAPITLAPGIQGYFLAGESQSPSQAFSSAMWQQDGRFYTIRFPNAERQNLLYMAASMAQGVPIRSAQDPTPAADYAPPTPSTQIVTLRDLFAPYRETLEHSLQKDWVMRLPHPVLITENLAAENRDRYQLHAEPKPDGEGFSTNLFACPEATQNCLVNQFSVSSPLSPDTQAALEQHQRGNASISLAPNIQAYFLEVQDSKLFPSQPVASVMWQQDGLVYRVQAPLPERQNILYMAKSMARSSLIFPAAEPILLSANVQEIVKEDRLSLKTFPRRRISIRKVNVSDSLVLKPKDIDEVIQETGIEEQALLPEDIKEKLIKIRDEITELYLERNFITSRALIPDDPRLEDNGIVELELVEGELAEEGIIICPDPHETELCPQDPEANGNPKKLRLLHSYVRSRLERGAKKPLNIAKLEEQLRLLRADPLIENIEASLQASGEPGKSVLIVRVVEASPFFYRVSFDNYSPPSVGSERVGVALGHRNLTRRGDFLSASYSRTLSGGVDAFDFAYQLPLNALDGTLQLRISPSRSRITDAEFEELGIRAQRDRYEIAYRQPLIRSARQEFALSFGFVHQEGQTFIFNEIPTAFGIGPDEDGFSRTSVFKFGQEYLHQDLSGGWSLRSEFNLGTNLFNATNNPDPVPDGQFLSWLGQVQRLQRLGKNHLLTLQAEVQLTPDTLLPAHQFVIGGGQSLRGYRQNARTADNGFRVSIANRITLGRDAAGRSRIELIPFFEIGQVWNAQGNPNELPEQNLLASAGLGFRWSNFLNVKDLELRLDYAIPFFQLDDRGQNLQDAGIYFNLFYGL